MDFQTFCGSSFWNESLTWNSLNPDFTSCFQNTILVWVPCGFFWLFLPMEIHFINKRSGTSFPWTCLNITKGIFTISLILLSFMEIINWLVHYNTDLQLFYVNLVSAFIKAITYLLITILMFIKRRKGVLSSGIEFIFWFLISLATTITFRSQMMKAIDPEETVSILDFVVCIVSYPLLLGELVLSAFVDSKPSSEEDKVKMKCPEKKSSFIARMTFTWFDTMAIFGWRNKIKERDIWSLDHENSSNYIASYFHNYWQPQLQKYQDRMRSHTIDSSRDIKKPSILSALWHAFRFPFVLGGIYRLLADMLALVNPIILKLLINYVSSDEPEWRGYFYAFLLLAAALLQSIFYAQSFLVMFQLSMKIRAALISSLYQKSMKMNSAVKRSATVGEIVNLMSVDTQKIMDLLPDIHVIWTAAIQIALAVYMLWDILGPSVLAGLAVLLLAIPLNGYFGRRFQVLQAKQMGKKDNRVKLMSEILNGIKVLKFYAWENSFDKRISEVRKGELKMMEKQAYIFASVYIVLFSAPLMVSLATFATYILIDDANVLDASKAFVSLSLFNIMRLPLFLMPIVFVAMIQAGVSLKRINKFLTSEELDQRAISHDKKAEAPIIIDNATFAWEINNESQTLKDINLTIPHGGLVAVVGPVGAGKSSLASAVLGDMEKLSGSVNTKGTFAYVAQQAWIQNATVKENIIFGKPLDQVRYDEVIDACALKPDFEILPGGDNTEIGEKGINLSGGQKQRVSLARAVYSQADVVILDDPLSAVDSHVGKHIFEKVIGPTGLLKDKTRLFVTNQIAFLPQVDLIIVLNGGRVTEQGTYDHLLEKNGDFATFLMTYIQEHKEELDDDDLTELDEIAQDLIARTGASNIERQLSRKSNLSGDAENEDDKHTSVIRHRHASSCRTQRSISRDKSIPKGSHPDMSKLIQEETTETGRVKWRVYVDYVKAMGNSIAVVCAIFYVSSAAFSAGSNVWLSIWSQDSVSGTPDTKLRDLRLGVYAGLGIGQALTIFLATLGLTLGSVKASSKFHSQMLSNILKCPMSFFDTTPLGRIVNRFSKDMDTVDALIPMLVRPLLPELLNIISTIIIISMSTPIFTVVVVPIGIAFFLIQRIYISSSRQLKRLESTTRSPIFAHFSETLSGTSTIRAYGRVDQMLRESEVRVDRNHVCFYPSIIANRWLAIRLDLLSAIVVFFAAIFAVMNRNSLDPGTIGLSITYAVTVTGVITFTVRMMSELETNIVAVERIKEYMLVPSEAAWEVIEFTPPQSWPEEGVVTFQHYSTRYRPGLDLILKNVTCQIQSGEKVGIVGRTGAGKSSLTLALFRIIEASEGNIFVDGINTSLIGLHALRSKLTIIPQDPVLFSGTLRMNLDPFENYKNEDLWEVLNLSHLGSFVSNLPMGLDHEIAEGGENVSMGQRQLLCLARALLRKTKVLVLDEATASVDLETDDLIQATIRKQFADCTVITIAHRLNTIMDSTRILLLDQGKICEFDSPETLLQDKKSKFYEMAKDAGLV